MNEEKLILIDEKEYVIDAINKHSTQKHFKPRVESNGAIAGTPLQMSLKLKVGAKIMLTYNVDTFDCLTNGAFGEILGFKLDQNGNIQYVYVHFENEDCGRERRKKNATLCKAVSW